MWKPTTRSAAANGPATSPNSLRERGRAMLSPRLANSGGGGGVSCRFRDATKRAADEESLRTAAPDADRREQAPRGSGGATAHGRDTLLRERGSEGTPQRG